MAPFLSALAWAGVFAMVLNPVQWRLARRIGRTRAAAATTVLAALIIVGPAIGVMAALVAEVTSLVQRIQAGGFSFPTPPDLQRVVRRTLRQQTLLPLPADLTSTITDTVKGVGDVPGRHAPASILQNVASLVFQLFVMLFGLFYFLRDGARIVRDHPAAAALRAARAAIA